jgi:hypothetical protein
MAEWSEDHVTVIGLYNSNSSLIGGILVKVEIRGPVGGKMRLSVGKVEKGFVETQHLQGGPLPPPPPRLCRLRTDGLAPTSRY